LDEGCASFETAGSRPPQDEEVFSTPAKASLMLRSVRRARLEARTTAMQRVRVSLKAVVRGIRRGHVNDESSGTGTSTFSPGSLLPDEIVAARVAELADAGGAGAVYGAVDA
jgi:hypothetical protein